MICMEFVPADYGGLDRSSLEERQSRERGFWSGPEAPSPLCLPRSIRIAVTISQLHRPQMAHVIKELAF